MFFFEIVKLLRESDCSIKGDATRYDDFIFDLRIYNSRCFIDCTISETSNIKSI